MLAKRVFLVAQRAKQFAERRNEIGDDAPAWAAICMAVGNESFDDWLMLT